MIGLGVSALGMLFGLVILNQLKNLPVHRSMREISELIYETCKTYLHDPGQVHRHPRDLHRRRHRALLRGPQRARAAARRHHPALQRRRHPGQLRRGVVRHPREHLRQLPHRVRQPRRQALPGVRDSAQGGHEHRHAADQRRAADHALHPALHPGRLRRPVLHRLRDRRVAGRRGAAHRRRHLHQDRRHRLGPDEDRLQHQGRRRAQPGRDCRLHRRQRRRLGGPQRRRLRDLRRDRRRAHHLHPAGGERPGHPGAAAGLDLRDARDDDHRQRRRPI